MKIISLAFLNNENIPDKYTCDGENINPPLQINEIPKAAQSLVLIVDDPDSPTGVWTHWLVWNIPATIKNIPENSLPNGSVEGLTTFGETGYGGPCPGRGEHHYHFKIFALDTILNLLPTANETELAEAMKGHTLDKAELVGLYKRK